MRERFFRFMQGRYGLDALSRFLMFFGLGIFVISTLFISDLPGRVVDVIAWLVLLSSYARVFSRNIPKRARENQWFLNKTAKFRGFFRQQRFLFRQRKTHKIYKCPTCQQKIRIPKGKGKIEVRCPKCGSTFIKKS